MFNVSIPKISDEELANRYERIKPIVRRADGKLYYLREYTIEELKAQSYIWNVYGDVSKEVKADTLEVMAGKDFLCLHRFGYHNFFKPSIAEILSQIDKNLLLQVKAFEIIEFPFDVYESLPDYLSTIAFRQGYHISKVRLYRAKS